MKRGGRKTENQQLKKGPGFERERAKFTMGGTEGREKGRNDIIII